MSTVEPDEQDLTRKQRREQARVRRKELEQQQAASAVRRTRLMQLGIVGVIVVALIVGIVVATSGGSKKGIATGKTEQTSLVTEVSSLIGGRPQNRNRPGGPGGPGIAKDLQAPGGPRWRQLN